MKAGKKLIITLSELKGMARQANETNVTSYRIVVSAVFVGFMGVISHAYRLNGISRIVVMLAGAAVVPLIMFYHYFQKRENIRFNQVDVYIHQMAYSFQRSPKIITALKDTYQIAEGNLKETVKSAALCMESEEGTLIYREALGIIEKAYPCDRVYTLHRFLISVEERGGDYSQPLSILLEDFDRWVRRVYKYQEDMRHVKINSLIGIIISCALAMMSVIISSMLDETAEIDIDVSTLPLYQAETLVFLLMNILYFVYVTVHYSRDWITPVRDEEKIMKDYRLAFGAQSKQIAIARCVMLAAMLAVSCVCFKMFGGRAALAVAALGIILYLTPYINKNAAQSRLRDDVYSGFSEWLREVAINLSHAPLQAAIQESYATAPAVIRPSLGRFIYELEENPSDVTPYYTFLKEFRILDISSTVKTLYAVTENDTENMSSVISNLISRKYELVDKHEAVRNQNNLSALRFAEYIPLLIVSIKIGIDMLLVINNYMTFA